MYTILTQEIGDATVLQAVNTLIGSNAITGPVPIASGNYVLISNDAITPRRVNGNGGTTVRSLFLVGHGSANGLSGRATWTTYRNALPPGTTYEAPDRIYIVSCGTAGEGNQLAYRNFADSVAVAFPTAIVWASRTNVRSTTMEGQWERVDRLPR